MNRLAFGKGWPYNLQLVYFSLSLPKGDLTNCHELKLYYKKAQTFFVCFNSRQVNTSTVYED